MTESAKRVSSWFDVGCATGDVLPAHAVSTARIASRKGDMAREDTRAYHFRQVQSEIRKPFAYISLCLWTHRHSRRWLTPRGNGSWRCWRAANDPSERSPRASP